MCVVHGGGGRVLGARVDELGEDLEVILEVGFDRKGLNLLEFFKRGAFG